MNLGKKLAEARLTCCLFDTSFLILYFKKVREISKNFFTFRSTEIMTRQGRALFDISFRKEWYGSLWFLERTAILENMTKEIWGSIKLTFITPLKWSCSSLFFELLRNDVLRGFCRERQLNQLVSTSALPDQDVGNTQHALRKHTTRLIRTITLGWKSLAWLTLTVMSFIG